MAEGIPINAKQSRKPIKTPATSTWYKGKHLKKLEGDYQKAALVIRLIIATGIRTDELPYVTVEAVKQGCIETTFNHSTRKVILPDDICNQLSLYANENGITSGAIFLTATGLPCGRNSMFHAFGKLAAAAGIEPERLTSEALRKYYNDKQSEERNLSAVQSSLGYKTVNYYVEYEPKDEETLLRNLEDMLVM